MRLLRMGAGSTGALVLLRNETKAGLLQPTGLGYSIVNAVLVHNH